MAEARFSPKTMSNYAQVVQMVVASAIVDDGEELYSWKWNHEFIDLPDVTGQRTPMFSSEEIEGIIAKAAGRYRVLYALLAGSA